MPAPALTEIRIAADPAAWRRVGFSVESDRCIVGGVRLEFTAGDTGIVDWALSDVGSAGIDGLPTRAGRESAGAAREHANRVTDIDHLVALTPVLERTVEALEAEGIELRRIREGETGMGPYRQAFFRVGRPILELVQAANMDANGPARFWGITFTTADIDAAAEVMGENLGRIKDAVQPGRQIATVRHEAALGIPVALITPSR